MKCSTHHGLSVLEAWPSLGRGHPNHALPRRSSIHPHTVALVTLSVLEAQPSLVYQNQLLASRAAHIAPLTVEQNYLLEVLTGLNLLWCRHQYQPLLGWSTILHTELDAPQFKHSTFRQTYSWEHSLSLWTFPIHHIVLLRFNRHAQSWCILYVCRIILRSH